MTDNISKCLFCSGDHNINECNNFIKESVENRWQWAQSKRVCFICLKNSHLSFKCKAKRCQIRGCKARHHTLLHNAKVNKGPGNIQNENQVRSSKEK